MRKTCLRVYANNKGADQPAHPRSLISTFVVHCLDSIIPLVSIPEISYLYLASVAHPKERFSHDVAHNNFARHKIWPC